MSREFIIPEGIPLPKVGTRSKPPHVDRAQERFWKKHVMVCTDVDIETRTITIETVPSRKSRKQKRRV